MSTIKSIDTIYNGYKFRSRLEARWAVFFDEMGFEYEYEPEGFLIEDEETGENITYLPDFKIYSNGTRVLGEVCEIYVEVKGSMTDEDRRKITAFAKHYPVLVLGNIPTDSEEMALLGFNTIYHSFWLIDGDWGWPALFMVCDGHPLLADEQRESWTPEGRDLVDKAFIKAKQARFEHGEKPRRD